MSDRDHYIARIRKLLEERSGRRWSVRGGTGTDWGWITIGAPPARLVDGRMTVQDRAELAALLGLDSVCGPVEVPASDAHRKEYVHRAAGLSVATVEPYWD